MAYGSSYSNVRIPGLGAGIAQWANVITAIGQKRDEEQQQALREKFFSGLLGGGQAEAPIMGMDAQGGMTKTGPTITPPSNNPGLKKLFGGMQPKELAQLFGSDSFTPQGLSQLLKLGQMMDPQQGSGPALITGEELTRSAPDRFGGLNLKGYVFQQGEDGNFKVLVQPERPVVAGPGSVIMDTAGNPIKEIPADLKFNQLSAGGQLIGTNPKTGQSYMIAQRPPEPKDTRDLPNVVLQVPGVDAGGQPTTTFAEFQRGTGGAPGRMVGPVATGVKSPPQPLAQKDLEDIGLAQQGVRALDMMAPLIQQGGTGRVQGYLSKAQAWLGTDQNAVNFKTAKDQLRLAGQSVIPGIPSNFDIQTYTATLPDENDPQPVAQAKFALTRQNFADMIATKIAYYKGTNRQLPPDLFALAEKLGINADQVPALDQKETVQRVKEVNVRMQGGAAKYAGGAPVSVSSKDEYDLLEPGTPFVWKGKQGVKP